MTSSDNADLAYQKMIQFRDAILNYFDKKVVFELCQDLIGKSNY